VWQLLHTKAFGARTPAQREHSRFSFRDGEDTGLIRSPSAGRGLSPSH
jgi:hypothetical protein